MNWEKVRFRLLGVDPDTLIAYRSAIPSSIDLHIETVGDSFVAIIKSMDKENLPKDQFLITEAPSQKELVDMVNDLIFSYKNIPESYRPYYRRILQPEGAARQQEGLAAVKAGDLKLVKAG
jgi:hypothetical protein